MKIGEIEVLNDTSVKDIWSSDLTELVRELEEVEAKEEEDRLGNNNPIKCAIGKRIKKEEVPEENEKKKNENNKKNEKTEKNTGKEEISNQDKIGDPGEKKIIKNPNNLNNDNNPFIEATKKEMKIKEDNTTDPFKFSLRERIGMKCIF